MTEPNRRRALKVGFDRFREKQSARVSPAFQMLAILVGNAIIALAVYIILEAAYKDPQPLPGGFLGAELALLCIAGFFAFVEFAGLQAFESDDVERTGSATVYTQSSEWAWWAKQRNLILLVVIYALFAATIFALYDLADKTGGGIASPFAALLAAPAIYGPLIARTRVSIALIVAITAGVIAYADATAHLAPTTAKPGESARSLLKSVDVVGDPKRGSYAAVAILLISVAAVITLLRRSKRFNPAIESVNQPREPSPDPPADADSAA